MDSCIWLNLFKKEESASKGVPHWKIAEDFIKQVKTENCLIFVSQMVTREISFKLEDKSELVEEFFNNNYYIRIVNAMPEDYSFARQLESESDFDISFYDCLHIAICRRMSLILVTRDRLLIDFAKYYIAVSKPEDLFLS